MKKTLSLMLVLVLLLSACALKSTSPAEVEVAQPEASAMEVQSAAPQSAEEGLAIPLSAGTATMALTPATTTVNVGQNFNLSVQVNAGTQQVNTVQVSLKFDPAYLEVVSLTQVGELDGIVQNTYDNTAGTISYAAGKLGGSATGTFSMLQIQFKAKAAAPSTAVQFQFVQPLASDVLMEGLSVLAAGGTSNAAVTVQSGGVVVPTVAPGTTPIPGTGTTYVVQAGDNLYRIGLKFGIPWPTIQSHNKLPSTLIYVGQVLQIPGSGGVSPTAVSPTFTPGNTHHTVVAGQNLFRIGLIYNVQWPAIMAANGLYSTLIYPGQVLFIP